LSNRDRVAASRMSVVAPAASVRSSVVSLSSDAPAKALRASRKSRSCVADGSSQAWSVARIGPTAIACPSTT
jgi:hypothetical protein